MYRPIAALACTSYVMLPLPVFAQTGAVTLTVDGVKAAKGSATAMARAPANPMLGGTGEVNMAAWHDNWPKAVASSTQP